MQDVKRKSPAVTAAEDNPLPSAEAPEESQPEPPRTGDNISIPQNGKKSSISVEELKKLPIWVNWILFDEPNRPKPAKIPKNPKNGYSAKVDDPKTWNTFEMASSKVGGTVTHRHYTDKRDKSKYTEHECKIAGVGFVFDGDIAGIDIDYKQGDPENGRQTETILGLFADTYAEKSPSGKGRHIMFRFDKSKIPTVKGDDGKEKLDPKYYTNNQKLGLECYFPGLTNKFFTYTGDGNGQGIEDMTEQVLVFLDSYMLQDNFKSTEKGWTEPPRKSSAQSNVDDLMEKACKAKGTGADFAALFKYGDVSGYPSQSEADFELCKRLRYWCAGVPSEIDRYFRLSALMRPKWDEKHGADTYGNTTIKKALSDWNGKSYTPHGRSKKEKAKREFSPEEEKAKTEAENSFGAMDDEKLTIAGVAFHLRQIGVSVKYNEIVRKAEINGLDKYNNNHIVDSFPIIIYNDLNLVYKKCTLSTVQDFLKVIMMNNAYNPVLGLIEGGNWDGVDRMPELFRIMRISDDDKLSKIFIVKWLWQNLSMLRNRFGEYGADGILVVKGGQGIGKTTFARKMALRNEFFGEGLLLDVRDKDTVIRAVSCWIGELGEIESTFKSDINALKAFITRSSDKYRLPYGRTAEEIPRQTSFIGTCNNDEYLIDETGNRRYWTVPINERMDLDALEKFDAFQMYLQINEKAKSNIQGFRLTQEEQCSLAERNNLHTKPVKGEFEIRDILFRAANNKWLFEEMTITEFKEKYPALKSYSANQISAALKIAGGITTESRWKDGKTQRLAMLPAPTVCVSDFP